MLLRITTLLMSFVLGLGTAASMGHKSAFDVVKESNSAIVRAVVDVKSGHRSTHASEASKTKRSNRALNWYVKRNPDHKQPTLDPNQKMIENYNAFYVDTNYSDDASEKMLYLTFDAGYENGNISKILDVLRDERVPAAFFILENLINKNADLVKRMANEGHYVCNHTMKHHDMSRVDSIDEFQKELAGLEALCYEKTGETMKKYYRPPEGRFDEENLKFADKLGYTTVLWSFAYADWDNEKQPSPAAAKEKILNNIHNGAIILLHPTSATNAEIMRDLIKTLKAEGYSFGTLDMLKK